MEKERKELAEKLDAELLDFVSSRRKVKYQDGFSEHNWEKEMQEHPAFRTEPISGEGELPPLIEAMQALKYDPNENTADELITNYKEDGNCNFKLKQYRLAVAAYTEGIKIKTENWQLRSQLYSNRAAAHFHLGNFSSSLKDCKEALKLDPNYIKAIIKGAQCCLHLQDFNFAIELCNKGLSINANEKILLDIRTKAQNEKKLMERNIRKQNILLNKAREKDLELLNIIKSKNIKFCTALGNKDKDELDNSEVLSCFKPVHPMAVGSRVHLDNSGLLVWPVILFYPEYEIVEHIQNFNETTRLKEQLECMFIETPSWDVDGKYKVSEFNVYYEVFTKSAIKKVSVEQTLLEIMTQADFTLLNGTPSFIILVNNTNFQKDYVKKYDCLL